MSYSIITNIIFFILGIVIGSFLNVCIFRIPKKESIVYGASHCMSCNKKIKWYDLFPVISYIVLLGKCRYCKAKLSPRYPAIELLTGIVYLLVSIVYGITLYSVGCCILFSILIVVSMIDHDTREIPDRFHICILMICPLFFFDGNRWWEHIIGFFAASAILLLLAELTKGFGGGDIKLMAVCGLCLSWKLILFALFSGIVVGGIYAVVFLIIHKSKSNITKSHIPFAPSLSIGIFLAALYGETILNMYMSLL